MIIIMVYDVMGLGGGYEYFRTFLTYKPQKARVCYLSYKKKFAGIFLSYVGASLCVPR